jgi:exodeoxyribonuclease VIII
MRLEDIGTVHVMLDLETMGTKANAPIVAIGAVKFTRDGLIPADKGGEFYKTVDLQSAVDAGASIDPATVIWWMKQSDAARSPLTRQADLPITDAMVEFEKWLGDDGLLAGVWGNGSAFDNTIYRESYARSRLGRDPWPFWLDRCYRTVKNLSFAKPMSKFTGVQHVAVDDARHQAEHLLFIHRSMPGGIL